MFNFSHLRKDESGQAALENAIILIAFVVVASVFAFTILSAGTSSIDAGEQAIYSGLSGVQSSMNVKGALIANGSAGSIDTMQFNLALVAGGDPVDLTTDSPVVISYRDAAVYENALSWTVDFITEVGTATGILEQGELAEITITLPASVTLEKNSQFTLEVKPPTGAVLTISRTTPPVIETVMELR